MTAKRPFACARSWPGADNRGGVFILHKDLDNLVFNAAANKAEEQSIVRLRTQRKVELGFNRVFSSLFGSHAFAIL